MERYGLHCWACKEPIQEGQKKCTECSSWQDWRNYINFSSTTIALIVALLSVVATLITLSEKFELRGVLVSVNGGVSEKYELEIFNWEEYPIKLSGLLICDLSGVFEIPMKKEDIYYVFTDRKGVNIGVFLHSDVIDIIIPPLTSKTIIVESSVNGFGPYGPGEWESIGEFIIIFTRRYAEEGWRFAPSNLDSVSYRPNEREPCIFDYNLPNADTNRVHFSNRLISPSFVSDFDIWWKEGLKQAQGKSE